MGAFSKIFQRLRLTPDTTVSTQTTAIIQSTSGSLALVPSGSGAIIASVPDGTTTGGNARGQYAVDLQMARTAAAQVANGNYSSIIGGYVNTASGIYSIAGGVFANATGEQSISLGTGIASGRGSVTIGGLQGGGNYPQSSGQFAIAIGLGNTASSNYSTISGGQSNTASTNTHATVVGGQSNTASGQYSVVLGGLSNTSSGQASIAGGIRSTASGQWAISLGYESVANQLMSIALGREAYAIGTNSIAIGGNNPGALSSSSIAIGDASVARRVNSVALGKTSNSYLFNQLATLGGTYSQASDLKAFKESTLITGATTVLSLDGTGTTELIIPYTNNTAWNVTIDTIAVVTTITGTATGVSVGDCYRETKQLLFKRIGGTSSIVGTVDTTAVKSDTSMSACAMTITTGASQEMTLTFTAPTFTGGGSVTCRVVSKVMLVEVAY
jgi:hypothetical protein